MGDEGLEVGGLGVHFGDEHFAAEVEGGVVPLGVAGFGDEDVAEELVAVDALVFEDDPLAVAHEGDVIADPGGLRGDH